MLKEQKHYNCLKYKIFKPGGRAMVVFYRFLQKKFETVLEILVHCLLHIHVRAAKA